MRFPIMLLFLFIVIYFITYSYLTKPMLCDSLEDVYEYDCYTPEELQGHRI